MSSFRLGKNEKWILIHCYLKTIKRDLPNGWLLPRGYTSYSDNEHFWNYLFKSEILLNLFRLKPSYKYPMEEYELYAPEAEYFRGYGYKDKQKHYDWDEEKRHNSALVRFNCSKNALLRKGLIKVQDNVLPNTLRINLTEEGIKKALTLIEKTQLNLKNLINRKINDRGKSPDSGSIKFKEFYKGGNLESLIDSLASNLDGEGNKT